MWSLRNPYSSAVNFPERGLTVMRLAGQAASAVLISSLSPKDYKGLPRTQANVPSLPSGYDI